MQILHTRACMFNKVWYVFRKIWYFLDVGEYSVKIIVNHTKCFLREQSNSQCTERQVEGKVSLAGYREHKTGSGNKGTHGEPPPCTEQPKGKKIPFLSYCSFVWGIHGVYVEYSWDIHRIYVCIGYVSGMCRVCIGNVTEEKRSEGDSYSNYVQEKQTSNNKNNKKINNYCARQHALAKGRVINNGNN